MARFKSGLGKGLAALVPSAGPAIEIVDIELILPNPQQPRSYFDPIQLEELAQSIREHGLIQPLLVTRAEPELSGPPIYQIIAGERRWQAARLAGLEKLPVVVREANSLEALELTLVENLQRADLNPLETAEAYRRLAEEFSLTQEEIAQKVGKKRTTVSNSLRLLALSGEMKHSVATGEISEGHARALLGVPDEGERRRLWERIVARGLSVRQTEEAARRLQRVVKRVRHAADVETAALEDRLRQALGTKVTLRRGRRGGTLVIHYYSDEELEAILHALEGNG
jgi:ParB family chromosome partitioning protein